MTELLDLTRFAYVEVEPVQEEDGFCGIVPEAPETAHFWTVYGRFREGHPDEGLAEALIDCTHEHSARRAADIFTRALLVPDLLEALEDLLGPIDVSEDRCVGCGRDYPGEGLELCPSDDCPRYKARAALNPRETS